MMRRDCRSHVIWCALLAPIVSAGGCEQRLPQTNAPARDEAQEKDGGQHAESVPLSAETKKGPLQLRISTPKTTIVQCEPVPVKFELKNVSNATLSVDIRLEPKWAQLLVEITPPGKKPYKLTYASPVTERVPREIKPHGSITHGRLLHHHWERGFLFKRPGQYRIQATFDDSTVRAGSNTLVVTVIKAEGEDAKALEEHWGCHPVGESVMRGTSDDLIKREFEAILTKYPTSVYAPWCEFDIALSARSRAQRDRSIRKEFGAEIFPTLTENAIRDYERFLKKHPEYPFPFPVQMRYEIAKMKLDLGRKEEALREIEELFEKHPEVDFLKEAKFKIDLSAKRGREVTAVELP